jgi:hypothetical protein
MGKSLRARNSVGLPTALWTVLATSYREYSATGPDIRAEIVDELHGAGMARRRGRVACQTRQLGRYAARSGRLHMLQDYNAGRPTLHWAR